MQRKRWYVAGALAMFLIATALGPSASAHFRKANGERVRKSHATMHRQQAQEPTTAGASTQQSSGSQTGIPVAGEGDDDFFGGHQHGGIGGHLPPVQENVDLVSKLKLTNAADDVSDVTATQAPNGKWYAYVGDWGAKCASGGVNVVDISNPANPVKVKFLNSSGSGYVTEGLQALHISTTEYTGDILVISNEWCRTMPSAKQMPGGITIWDINDPTAPKKLVEAFGDFDIHGNRANESHSAIAWDDDPAPNAGDAYVAAIDNEEIEDVDIFEITDPRNPELIAETNLPGVNVNAYGSEKTSHDFDILWFPDGTWHLMVSDWDAGWIDVDVTNPEAIGGVGAPHDGTDSNPLIVGDHDYEPCDRLIPTACPPEGNAHQGEWTADGSLFLGTDEDSSPFRLPITIQDGSLAGELYPAGEFGWTKQVASFPDGKVNGPMVFGGYGCPGSTVPSPSILGTLDPGEEKIIVFQRGPVDDPNNPGEACFFSDKVRSGEEAGYDVVIIANHHLGSNEGEFPDSFLCGSQGSPVLGTAAGLCVGHRFMHEVFGYTPDYTLPYPLNDPGDLEPDPGDLGPTIEAASQWDGWGCVRLLEGTTEVDEYCLTEELDQSFASGFGDLTVHEVEIPRGDPDEGGSSSDDGMGLSYYSWYSGGFRVAEFYTQENGDPGVREVGAFIDQGGNDFWGVALAENPSGDRIVLGSDRDFGLYIFRYTG